MVCDFFYPYVRSLGLAIFAPVSQFFDVPVENSSKCRAHVKALVCFHIFGLGFAWQEVF